MRTNDVSSCFNADSAHFLLLCAGLQAREGDVKGERPMWDETGNVNYNGKAKWDAWKALKVRVPVQR